MEKIGALVRLAQNGDIQAFTEIVVRFQDMAYGYAFAYLNDFTAAQDVAQESFIDAYRSLKNLREPQAFPAWFKRILFKHCDRQTRGSRPVVQSLEEYDQLPIKTPSPDEIIERTELANRIRTAILALPLDQRLVTTLYYINGYSQGEIAEFLEVPAKTIKSRLHSSRLKMKKRMMDMVQEELQGNTLPKNFTKETVNLAINQAKDLNVNLQYEEAEKILREVLVQVPQHSGALKELNRSLMRGQVYANGRWDLLPELVEHGKTILAAHEDEETCNDLAKTLLALPAMSQAATFIESWIEKSGPNLERLGMLAWARGCLGEYPAAESLWHEQMQLSEKENQSEVLEKVSFCCMTLVDCFTSAGNPSLAQKIAHQGWNLVKRLDLEAFSNPFDYYQWIRVFFQAGFDIKGIAFELLSRYNDLAGIRERGEVLCIRANIDDPTTVMADWLDWTRDCVKLEEWSLLGEFRLPMIGALRMRAESVTQLKLAQATWSLLRKSSHRDLANLYDRWNEERFNFFTYYDRKDWAAMEEVARQGIQASGMDGYASGVIIACAARGEPTPADIIQTAELSGVESIDSYGLFGRYLLAREAAAKGNGQKAFNALRQSVGYWSNPPLLCLDIWENDLRWGNLLQHTEFKMIIDDKRKRIGPIYGQLHYFPGW